MNKNDQWTATFVDFSFFGCFFLSLFFVGPTTTPFLNETVLHFPNQREMWCFNKFVSQL